MASPSHGALTTLVCAWPADLRKQWQVDHEASEAARAERVRAAFAARAEQQRAAALARAERRARHEEDQARHREEAAARLAEHRARAGNFRAATGYLVSQVRAQQCAAPPCCLPGPKFCGTTRGAFPRHARRQGCVKRRRPRRVTLPGVPRRRRADLLEWSRDWITLEDLDERIAEALESPVPLWPGEWGEKTVGAEEEEDRYPDDPVDMEALDDVEVEPANDGEPEDEDEDDGDWEDEDDEDAAEQGPYGARWGSGVEERERVAAGPARPVLPQRAPPPLRPPAAPGRRIVPPEDS